jgi:hypothetical protein
LRRLVRERRIPEREAVDLKDGKIWKKAMDKEMAALDKNEA